MTAMAAVDAALWDIMAKSLNVALDLHLLHDVHHCLTPNEAARLGKDLEL